MDCHFLKLTYENNIAVVGLDIPPANRLSSGCITYTHSMTIGLKTLNEDYNGVW